MTAEAKFDSSRQSQRQRRVERAKGIDASDRRKSQLNTELSPQHRLNRLEHEHGYLAEQNSHLNRELSSARHTIATLRTITVQKEKSLQAVQQELDQAYFRIRLLSMTLARHLLSHQHAEEGSGPIQLDRQDAFEGYMDKGRVNSS